MKEKDLNVLRTVLLASVVIAALLTAFIYFYKGTFNIGSPVIIGSCLLIYMLTGKKKTNA